MKIRSLLLGSVAAVGLSTGAFATDLGVETSLDVCDELGLSGLTISSDTNCLQITGKVDYEFNWGNYEDNLFGNGTWLMSNFSATGDVFSVIDDYSGLDSSSDIDYWLKFVATASSSFGPATATLKLSGSGGSIGVDEAWVGVGDTTMLMAGLKDSIFKDGDDEPLNFLGLFESSSVDTGVTAGPPTTGGHVIQLVSDLGNGLWIGGGLEDLAGSGTAVGVLSYSDDNVSAHISIAGASILGGAPSYWATHAGVTGTWDAVKFVGAVAANSGGYWDALGSLSYTMEGFTLAVSGEATAANEWGIGGSIGTEISDGVSINLGARHYTNGDVGPSDYLNQVAAQIVASVTDEVTLTGEVGAIANGPGSLYNPGTSLFYGKGEIAWAPGGGFTSSVSGEINSLGGYKATFKAAKTIE